MQSAAGISRSAAPTSLDSDASRMAGSLEKAKYLCLLVITVVYAAGAMLHARAKPLWYDEIFTVVAASAPDAAGTWNAAQKVDASPPLPHLLTHFAMQWFGGGEVATRLPAIAGFWIFCLCMFWFIRRRLGIFYGFTALLLPLATGAYEYAYEARAYGLELGFCGAMLVSWQAATSRGPRERLKYALSCAAIAFSLMGALMCQYYAVLLYLPLAGGEAYRAWKSRRISWAIWMAMAFGSAPLVWRLATIRAVVSGFSQVSWSQTYPIQALEFWNDNLQPALAVLVLALAVMALWNPRIDREASFTRPFVPLHEILAGILLLAIPAAAVAVGMLVTHVYTARYALPGIAGVVLLVPAVAARLSGRPLTAFLTLALATVPLIVVTTTIPGPRDPISEETLLVEATRQGPVVVADGQLFVQMWHYLPEPQRSNLLFLVDADASVKYQAFNTAAINSALADFRRWYPVRVVDYRDFATPGAEFRVLQNPLKPGWLLEKIAADGGSESIERYTNLRQLYRIRMK